MQATLAPSSESLAVLNFDHAVFQKNFNQQWFALEHTLANHPLFTVERLVQLAKQTAKARPADLYFDKGATRPGQRWNETPACDLPIDETIRRLEYEGAWIILKHADIDPDYKSVLTRAMGEVFELAGREMLVGDTDAATTTLKQVQHYALLIHLGLANNTKRLMNAQMLMHHTTRRLGEFVQSTPFEDRDTMEATLKQLTKVEDELLNQVFIH